jgi:hypothetical protein
VTSPRERLVEAALARGALAAEDVRRAGDRRAEYLPLGADVPVEDLLADAGRLSRDDLEDATRGEEIPSRLLGLEVLRLAGGTPEQPVYLARRTVGGDCLLVYACLLRRGDAPAEVDAFLRAADLARRVTGPLWVPLRDAGGADGAYAVAGDVPDGVRLDEAIERDGPVPPEQALAVVRTLAEGLRPLEALGVTTTFPDPSLVYVSGAVASTSAASPRGRLSLVAFEVLRAARGGLPDGAETARSAGRLLARLVGPERVQDPVVRDALDALARGRLDPLRPAAPPPRATGRAPSAPPAPTPRAGPGSRATASTPSRPAPTRRRGAARWAIGATAQALVAGAGAVAVLSSRGDRSNEDGDGAGTESLAAGAGAGPAPVGRDPTAPGPTHSDPAWTAYEDALAFRNEARGDARAVIDRFRAVEERYAGSRAAAEAGARRQEFAKAREAEADAEAQRLLARVEPLLRADDVGGALDLVRAFPASLRDTAAAKRVAAIESRALAKAETYFTARLAAIDGAAVPGGEEAAKAAVDEVRRLGVDDLTKTAQRRLADAKERAAAALARRKDLEPELVRVAGEAIAAAGRGDAERAGRVLDLADRGPLRDAFGARLDSAREAARRVERLFAAAAAAAKGRAPKPVTLLLREYRAAPFPVSVVDVAGDRISYTRGGTPGSVRMGALDPETVVRLALADGRETDATLTLAAATLYAACGRFAQSDATLEAARRLGAAEGAFAAEADAVRTWLAAAASREVAAADAVRESDREAARQGYARAAVTAPFLADPHRRLGEAALAARAWDDALAEFERARALGGSSPDLLHAIATATAAAPGRGDAAVLEAWRQFLRTAPADDPRAEAARAQAEAFGSRVLRGATEERVRAAKALLDAGKAAEALATLEEAVAGDPSSGAAHADLARAAEKAGDVVRAYRAWRTVRAIAKSVDEAGRARGQMDRLERLFGERGTEVVVRKSADEALARGEASSAADLYRRAIGMSPLDARARVGLGTALRHVMLRASSKAYLDEALAALDTAIVVAPDDPAAYHARADLRLYVAQDRGGAVEDATAAIERRKEFAEAYYTRGVAYYLSLQFEAALADVTVVKTLRPVLAMPRITRSGVLEALHRYDEAETELAGAAECQPTEAESAMIKAAKDRIAQRRRADRR